MPETTGKETTERKSAAARAKTATQSSRTRFLPTMLLQSKGELSLYLYENKQYAPVIAGPFPKGTILLLLDDASSHGYRRVTVPGGFAGFVFAKFVEEGENGLGFTSGENVGFRYRPRPTRVAEPPLAALPAKATLRLVAREGDWWKCLSPSFVGAWVEESAVEGIAKLDPSKVQQALQSEKGLVAAIDDAAIAKRYAEQKAAQESLWLAARERIAKAAKRKQQIEALQVEAKKIYDAFLDEKGAFDIKDEKIADKSEAMLDVQKRVVALEADEEPVGHSIRAYLSEIHRRRILQEAELELARNEPKVEAKTVDASAVVAKRRFVFTGWLRHEPVSGAQAPYRIMMGGKTICFVKLAGAPARYDLKQYRGCELGLRGRVIQSSGVEAPVVSVDRLVVLTGR